jgi:ferredoxin-NADP reductase
MTAIHILQFLEKDSIVYFLSGLDYQNIPTQRSALYHSDEGQFQRTGYVDTALIQSLVSRDAEFFLCGSPPFLKSIGQGLQAWGVPEDRVFFESFMKARTVPSENISDLPPISLLNLQKNLSDGGAESWKQG